MPSEYIAGYYREEPIIIIFFVKTLHYIFGAAVKLIIFTVFIGNKAVYNGDYVITLFCNHGVISFEIIL